MPTQTSTTKDQIDKRIPTKISSKKKATAPVLEDAYNGTVQIHSGTKDGPIAKGKKKQAPSIQDSRGQSMQITSSNNRFAALSLDGKESDLEILNDDTDREAPKGGKGRNGVKKNVSIPTGRKKAGTHESMNDHMNSFNNQL